MILASHLFQGICKKEGRKTQFMQMRNRRQN